MNIDLQAIIAMVQAHAWLPLAALVIGLMVRLMKSDSPLPKFLQFAAPYRPWIALGLGVGAGVLDKVVSGSTWQAAIVWGLGAAVTAIVGHELVIESLRGGKELPIRPAKAPPVIGGALLMVVLGACAAGTTASCKDAQSANNFVNAALDVEQIACVLLQAELGTNEPAIVANICKIDPSLLQDIAHLLTAHRKAEAAFAAMPPKGDGGAK